MVVAARDTLTKIKKNRKREIQQQLGRCSKRSAVQNALSYRACGGCCHNHLRYTTAYASIHLFGCYIHTTVTQYSILFLLFWGERWKREGERKLFWPYNNQSSPRYCFAFCHFEFLFSRPMTRSPTLLAWASMGAASWCLLFLFLLFGRHAVFTNSFFYFVENLTVEVILLFFSWQSCSKNNSFFSSPPIYHFNIDYKTAVGSFLFLRRF